MDYREFAAEEGEEVTTRRNHRPPNLSLSTVAHEDIAYPLPHLDDPRMLGDPSTSIDLQCIPQPTSLVPFQSNQLLAAPAGPVQAQETYLPEEALLQLAEVEWQHEAARYHILEKAQAIPANSHVREAAAGFTGVYNTSSVPAYPPQIPNPGFIWSDSSSTYGLDVHSSSGQQFTPMAIYPNTLHDHVQDFGQQGNTCFNAQGLHDNALDHAEYGQQPPIDPMALETPNYNISPSMLSLHGRGNQTSSPMIPTQYHQPKPRLSVRAGGLVPAPASQLPAYLTNNFDYGATGPLAASPPCNQNVNPPADPMFATTMHELPPFAEISLAATNKIGIRHTIGREKSKRGKKRRIVTTSPYHRRIKPGYEMENVSIYTSPRADRQQQMSERRIYSKRPDKSESSCFGCRRSKRKCTTLTGVICLQCQKILRTYSDRTVLPKFTCNVRTKFSEISIFTDITPTTEFSQMQMQMSADSLSRISRLLKIDLENQYFPATAEASIDIHPMISVEIVRTLFHGIKGLLDILEPLKSRRHDVTMSDISSFWSYSFSMLRWRKSICFFWPDLQDALKVHENCHRYMHRFFLRELDHLICSGNWVAVAALLNEWYEIISAMEDTPLVDISAKEHLLASLTHHLLHVYRILLPGDPKKLQQNITVELLTIFCNDLPRTLDLIPERWQMLRRGYRSRVISESRRKHTMSQGTVKVRPGTASSRDSRPQSERPAPQKAYIPSGFLDLFGLNTEMQNSLEGVMQGCITPLPSSVQEELLDLSPWTLSVGLGVFSNLDEDKDISKHCKVDILYCIVAGSLYAWEKAIDSYNRSCERNRLTVSDFLSNRDIIEEWMIESIESTKKTLILRKCSHH